MFLYIMVYAEGKNNTFFYIKQSTFTEIQYHSYPYNIKYKLVFLHYIFEGLSFSFLLV